MSTSISSQPLSEIANLLDRQLLDLRVQVSVVEQFANISLNRYGNIMAIRSIEPPLEPKEWEEEEERVDRDYEEWLDSIYNQ